MKRTICRLFLSLPVAYLVVEGLLANGISNWPFQLLIFVAVMAAYDIGQLHFGKDK